jgi:hypothetical protein
MDIARALLERLNVRIVLYWAVIIGGAWLFMELADEIYADEGLPFDEPILTWMNTIRDPLLDTVMIVLSTIGNVFPMVLITVAGTAFFWRYRRREGIFFALSMAGAVLIGLIAARAGVPAGDPVAALVVVVLVWVMAGRIGLGAVHVLMDRRPEGGLDERFRTAARGVEGVVSVEDRIGAVGGAVRRVGRSLEAILPLRPPS